MFTPLNVKTYYSFLSSTISLEGYISAAKNMGYKNIGIMDQANLHAAYSFIKLANNSDLNPIIGFEASLLLDGVPATVHLIAKNTAGYKNLLKVSTKYNYGRRNFEDFLSHLDNIAIAIPQRFRIPNDNKELDIYTVVDLDSNPNMKSDYPILPLPVIRYLNKRDSETLYVLQAVRDGSKLDESLVYDSSEYLQSPDSFASYFDEKFPGSVKTLENLASNIKYDLEENLSLPVFNKKIPAVEELRDLAFAGLEKQISNFDEIYEDRLNHELLVIHDMGFDDYFLIVADLLRYARSEDIYTGMGRGSAAGSLVAYALEITHVDPVKNNLLFERFLNPERYSMPDIDIDIPNDKRYVLLNYVKNRYGQSHSAQILTYSTFGMKQSLRDVAKVYGMTDVEATNLTKMIHGRTNLKEEYANNNRFRSEILKDSFLKQIYDTAVKIEGFPRQTSIHASGVVLAENELTNYTPLAPGDNLAITQYEAYAIEDIGLLKIDFLGLRNLSLIEKMKQLVLKKYDKEIDFLAIDLEDQNVLEIFRQGNTMGIFQFENPQMLKMLRRLKPDKFDDIVNATSIFRPGPSQNIDSFIKRRHGQEVPVYPDDSIKDILEPTYGIMIYQEQIIQIANRYAGFSLSRADLLRRAISKKNLKEIEALKQEFVSGSVANGHTESQAIYIYELIEKFANYGFNRSHAYAYAALAYQLTFFKAYYPDAFYEALLTDGKREIYLADAQKNGFDFAKLSINSMPYHDKISGNKINLGLSHVKGVPKDMALHIINERPYSDFSDFIKKLPENFQKPNYINPLIEIGAFENFDSNRKKLVENLPKLIEYNQTIQLDLFGLNSLNFSYQDFEDYSQTDKYNKELELLSVALTPHPLTDITLSYTGEYTPTDKLQVNKRQTILVELIRIREHKTKTGEKMVFLTVQDSQGTLDVTLFPESFRQYRNLLQEGGIYLMMGKVSSRNDRLQMVADRVILREDKGVKLWINLENSLNNQKIASILRGFPGFIPVILHFQDSGQTRQIEISVEENGLLLNKLEPFILKTVYR